MIPVCSTIDGVLLSLMSLPIKIILASLFCLLTLLPATSSAEIYKCYVAGKLVFTDEPCDGEKGDSSLCSRAFK